MSTSAPAPRTVGELRRLLTELGDPWTVDPALSDDAPLPDPPRGALLEEEAPEELRLEALPEEVDLRDLLSAQPPANPDLRARWREAGLLPPNGGER
ncbi:hypothetical protein ABZ864_06110 [Streptomyces sp. NPDC047082]|uniref:hypothetical protein n=1 Tax=Streptomyces sp. NPDC047082 TaxID=3155259 RepID=UPI0033F3DE5E